VTGGAFDDLGGIGKMNKAVAGIVGGAFIKAPSDRRIPIIARTYMKNHPL
jgi:hypothetical protein